MTDVARLSAIAMSGLIKAGEVSPTECTVAVLDRMAAWAPALNAFVDFDPEGALIQARAATDATRHGVEIGPLHGIPVTVKNNQAVRGFMTHRGSRLTPTEPAAADTPLGPHQPGALKGQEDLLQVRLGEPGALGNVTDRGRSSALVEREREERSAGVVPPGRNLHLPIGLM
jgi:hypothetical protein